MSKEIIFMAYCSKCGAEVLDEAEICVHCGCRIKSQSFIATEDGSHAVRFINHTSLKPAGWKSRTCAYFFLGIITFGIYVLVASVCNFTFKPDSGSNIGYFKDSIK